MNLTMALIQQMCDSSVSELRAIVALVQIWRQFQINYVKVI